MDPWTPRLPDSIRSSLSVPQGQVAVQEALELALDAETKAYEFFDQALPQISEQDVRELFDELRQEEIEHQDLVKKVMDKVETEPDFDPDDFVDEPIGH